MMKIVAFLAVIAVAHASVAQYHADRVAEVERINNLPGMTWKAGINTRFAGLPLNASKSLCGIKSNNQEVLQNAINDGTFISAEPVSEEIRASLPASFDSATNWPKCANMINDIRDQSNCGCCWAFGAVEAASDRLCIATNATIIAPLSAQEMCFCASFDGCDGGDVVTPWSYITTYGISSGAGQGNGTYDKSGFCSKFSLPHCHHHGPQGSDPYPDEGAPGCPSFSSPACPSTCDSTSKSPYNNFKTDRYTFVGQPYSYSADVPTIQNAIMTGGPVEAAFTVYSDFENYVSGIYQPTSSQVLGGHAIKIVGWGTENGVDYWKVANSWNPFWGEQGYFRIIRGVDSCGIEDSVTASSPGATWKHI